MTDARAGVHIVVAEGGAHHLLHEEGLLVRAARRGDSAHRTATVLRLDALELGRGVRNRLIPGHFAPGIVDRGADHGLQDAVAVLGIAPGEAPLDAGMAAVRLARFRRRHAHDLVAAHFRVERAADAAIAAGRLDRTLGRADVDHGLFDQRRRRARLYAGAARHALRFQERHVGARRDARFEAAPADGERERPLHFLAGTHAARADDAFGGVVGEIRIGLILLVGEMVVAIVAVAHVAKPDRARHILQLAIAIGGAGQAIERMIGDVEFHHAAAELLQPFRLCTDDHALRDRRGAGRRRARAPIDLDEAKTAGAKGVERIRGAELGHLEARHRGRAHDRGAFGHFHHRAVHDRARPCAPPRRRAFRDRYRRQAAS